MFSYKYLSLFSGGGIGDIGFRRAGLNPIVFNELDSNRAELIINNYPDSDVVVGDIKNNIKIISDSVSKRLQGEELFMIWATPPCQGMSKNGMGTINKAITDGKRNKIDERNYLYKYALTLIQHFHPIFFCWENVDRMFNTYLLDDSNQKVPFVNSFTQQLQEIGYFGKFEIHDMADYGLPQHRKRAIGVFVRQDCWNFKFDLNYMFPEKTIKDGNYKTVDETIGLLPPLDSRSKELAKSDFHPLHYVPVSRPELYYWIENTLPKHSAFENNTCPECHHVSQKTSVFCEKCGTLLPKPVVKKNGEVRIIKGFVSTYKRMSGDEPAPTITTRSAYACSDKNIHPTQNRVLSLYEVALLFGIDVNQYDWTINNNGIKKYANATLLRDVLGEPVTPVYTFLLGKRLKEIVQDYMGLS